MKSFKNWFSKEDWVDLDPPENSDLVDKSDKEFMDAWDAEGAKFTDSKNRLKEFSAEHNRRVLKQAAIDKLAAMSDTEKSALVQMMQAEGIESEESVNNG
jgi:RPA family protein